MTPDSRSHWLDNGPALPSWEDRTTRSEESTPWPWPAKITVATRQFTRINYSCSQMKPFQATSTLLVGLMLADTSADQLICFDDEHNFNICLNINGLEENLTDSFVAARNRWDAAIDGDLKDTSLVGINDKYLCNPWPRYVSFYFDICASKVPVCLLKCCVVISPSIFPPQNTLLSKPH